MARKDEQGLMQATAEDLQVITPEAVPEWVDCFVSKRQVPGEQARQVVYQKGKNVWIHKRFLGEFDHAAEEEEERDLFAAEYEDLGLEDTAELAEDEAEAAPEAEAAKPAEEPKAPEAAGE